MKLLFSIIGVGVLVTFLCLDPFADKTAKPTVLPPAQSSAGAPVHDADVHETPGPFDYVAARDKVPYYHPARVTETDVYTRNRGELIVYGCAKEVGIDARGAQHAITVVELRALTTCIDHAKAGR